MLLLFILLSNFLNKLLGFFVFLKERKTDGLSQKHHLISSAILKTENLQNSLQLLKYLQPFFFLLKNVIKFKSKFSILYPFLFSQLPKIAFLRINKSILYCSWNFQRAIFTQMMGYFVDIFFIDK